MSKYYYVYIMTNKPYGTLYIGVTSNLIIRVWQHKNKINKSFTAKYHLDKLVYYETFANVLEAIAYEKKLKAWYRKWKIALISDQNPKWVDLYNVICG